jgi:5'-nucleotidase/UDP-sugar diphosphatase
LKSPESDFFKAEPMIIGYNLMQVDAVNLGNHEFDNSREVLEAQKELADFPLISANVLTQDAEYVADAPYVIKEFQGVKVGIFGLTTRETEIIGTPANVADLAFNDEIQTAQMMVSTLKYSEGCDVIIALVHMGLYSDPNTGSRALAAQVPGIDLIVDGHTHTALTEPVRVDNGEKEVPIVSAYQWGLNVGKGVLMIEDKKVVDFAWFPVTINDKKAIKNADGTTSYEPLGPQFAQNVVVEERLADYGYKVDAILKEKIGNCAYTFPNAMSRKAETEIGDLVADSMLYYSKLIGYDVDFAMNNGGGIRADMPEGPITKKTAYTILPFDNTIRILTIKGSDIKALFDFLPTIAQGKGAFPQVSDGVTFTINYDAGTCDDVMIGGKEIDPDRLYKVATNNYMADGGDGYVAFKKAIEFAETNVFQRDAFIEYLKSFTEPVEPVIKGRITILGSKTAALWGFIAG